MSNDGLYHIIELIVQIVGLAAIVFKSGRWIGESSEMFKTLTASLSKNETALMKHVDEDREEFQKIHEKLTEIQVEVAGKGN